MKVYRVIGLMSGSSLDGLDMAYCEFWKIKGDWHFRILQSETVAYNRAWKDRLSKIRNFSAEELLALHSEYGYWSGRVVKNFMERHKLFPQLIASHGHTVFHQPSRGFSFQLGSGQAMAQVLALPVIYDFRQKDVLMGGQGAPLVPIGDELLFKDHDACLNIGGIANVSYSKEGKRYAFDLGPANQLLNNLSLERGMAFDRDGKIAASGRVDQELLKRLEKNLFYQKPLPRSLSNEYVEQHFLPLLRKETGLSWEDRLHTATVHIGRVIGRELNKIKARKVLVTGGGAKNKFLIRQIQTNFQGELVIPEETLIDYKEAMIFALMGVLRYRGEVNCLASATGASRNCSTGVIAFPE
jgi:anhydro-N-acetylmuramic acid kinase